MSKINGVCGKIKKGGKYSGRKLVILGNDIIVDRIRFTPIIWKWALVPRFIPSKFIQVITTEEFHAGSKYPPTEKLLGELLDSAKTKKQIHEQFKFITV